MWAIIPINNFTRSFGRLSPILNQDERIQLAKYLSTRLIHILLELNGIQKIMILTSETNWSEKIKHPKLVIHKEKNNKAFKSKIDSAADWACEMGAKQLMYLSIDIPLVEKNDIKAMIDSHNEGLTIVEAKKDGGTNALICELPRRFDFQFGKNSFFKHLKAAELKKVDTNIQHIDGLSFDLDDQDDWECFLEQHQPEKNPLKI
jgi:2-phospho-L-lactate guanylyltransferase